jgi:hypothetical protein
MEEDEKFEETSIIEEKANDEEDSIEDNENKEVDIFSNGFQTIEELSYVPNMNSQYQSVGKDTEFLNFDNS